MLLLRPWQHRADPRLVQAVQHVGNGQISALHRPWYIGEAESHAPPTGGTGLRHELRVTAQATHLVHAVPTAPSLMRGLCALPREPG